MQFYARIAGGVVAEILTIPDGADLADYFHADIVAALVAASSSTSAGQTYSGGAFGPVPIPPAPTKAQLTAYANAKQWALATGGHSVTVNGASHVFATDPVSLTMMGGKVARLAQPSPPASFNWQTPDGAWLTIAAGDFPAVATACADFVQATFDALKTVEAQIAAATITTTAQIDAFAWPA